jgi:hypothetical protein
MKIFKNIKINSFINKILRNIYYPISRKVYTLPATLESSDGMPLVIICQTKEFKNALWSAYSWLVNYPKKLKVKLFIDGPISMSMQNVFRSLFPVGEILSASEATSFFISSLDESHGFRRFVKKQRFSRKLSICISESSRGDILYSDSDVLCFQPGEEISDWLSSARRPTRHLVDPVWPSQDEWLNERMCQIGIQARKGLNSGMLMLKQGFIGADEFFALFETWSERHLTWHTDQTFFSNILLHQGSVPLDENKYINEAPEFFITNPWIPITNRVNMRHYVSSIRHLFYLQGLAKLLDMQRCGGGAQPTQHKNGCPKGRITETYRPE